MSGDAPITLCGSLSLHPVPLGMRMHNAGYQALGLPYTYVPFACREDGLEAALGGMRALGIRGFGVSMPFKISIMQHLDEIDELAGRIDAVNTVVNDDGKLSGYNTDAWGSALALQEATPLADKRCLLIGAGGAARAVAYSLTARGMKLDVANRSLDRAEALAADVERASSHPVGARRLGAVDSLEGYDVLVNASSAGMTEYGADSPISSRLLGPRLVVMDIVYKPIRTRLIEDAAAAGAQTVHGGRMLLHQACGQFELYTGRPAPIEAMNRALEAAIGN